MYLYRASLITFLAAGLIATPAFAVKVQHTTASSTSHPHTAKAAGKKTTGRKGARKMALKSHKLHGQQVIAPERVTQIQQALIREHYLTGEANGQWDAPTQAAMQKYQAAQGWQTKLMPDSRALVKLGLGPDYSTAINATKDSSFVAPAPVSTIPADQATGFAAAAGVN